MELKAAGGLTVRQVCQQLGVSMNAARHHLRELEASGLVTHEREQPSGVGAPAHVFRLTPRGEALFPRRYEDALTRLLDHVVAREGREAAVEVFESRYREMAERLRTVLAEAGPEERMAEVSRTLAAEGYMPEFRTTTGADGAQLVEHNCPIQQVAERFPEICEAEARFLAEVLEAEVTRGAHIVSGCGTCEYEVRPVPLTRRAEA